MLTARKQCQLEFAKSCLLEITSPLKTRKDLTNSKFFENRLNKYKDKTVYLYQYAKLDQLPYYFSPWLSGFIEAEGHFSVVKKIRKDGSLSVSSRFAIGQNDELHILEWIKRYFNSKNTICKDKPKSPSSIDKNHYRLYLYNAESRKLIFDHFNKYPLLGYKKVSYDK